MKSHRGAAKRFRRTGTGKLRRRRANKNHILEKKSPKRKRQLRAPADVSPSDERMLRDLGI
jgi:large subunit ribosomal protein L35